MLRQYVYPTYLEEKNQGVLRVFEFAKIPFSVRRVFTIDGAQAGARRGQHAHKACNQLISCVRGQVKLVCDDGSERVEIELSPTTKSVLVPAGIWAEQEYIMNGSVIVVFCDQSYDEGDYIRDYEDFLTWKGIN